MVRVRVRVRDGFNSSRTGHKVRIRIRDSFTSRAVYNY